TIIPIFQCLKPNFFVYLSGFMRGIQEILSLKKKSEVHQNFFLDTAHKARYVGKFMRYMGGRGV
ncbi:hypothetical protein ACTAZI_15390, partial [Legionella bozemanae]|uniref:hypothetical protein n=1 Tax=Legionella bozemanae TaxID=447 RepID=UPI003EEB01F9